MSIEQAIEANTAALKELAAAISAVLGAAKSAPSVSKPEAESEKDIETVPVAVAPEKPLKAAEIKKLIQKPAEAKEIPPEQDKFIRTTNPVIIPNNLPGNDGLPEGERDVAFFKKHVFPFAKELMDLTGTETLLQLFGTYMSEGGKPATRGTEVPPMMWGHLLKRINSAIKSAKEAAKSQDMI